ncbi:MAG: hypothetical protein Q8L11_03420 [Candidatus Moranbacteria bacterium]|nr:hypothetical protein [Candidatus Moranbacteria bacterium]
MYSLENIRQFLEKGWGNAIDPEIKAAILVRAKERMDDEGMIMGGSTSYIMGDECIEREFEYALGSDMNQLAILIGLAKKTLERKS